MDELPTLIRNIKDTIVNIERDKSRLDVIMDTINSNETHIDINDRLIKNLSGVNVNDDELDIAIEYIVLLFSNFESQKINHSKNTNEELLKLISHLLGTVKNLEECALATVTNALPTTVASTEVPQTTTGNRILTLIENMLPNNKVANTLLWVIITFSVIGAGIVLIPEAVAKLMTIISKIK